MDASHDTTVPASTSSTRNTGFWIGWLITAAVGLLLGMSGVMKLQNGPEVVTGMAAMGLPEEMLVPLALIELTCLAVYLIPASSVLGAILLTGYMGGAMCTHWRVGEPYLVPFGLGIALWLGIALREPRLWQLIPMRRCCGSARQAAEQQAASREEPSA